MTNEKIFIVKTATGYVTQFSQQVELTQEEIDDILNMYEEFKMKVGKLHPSYEKTIKKLEGLK